jgi:hypothetical protein
MAATKRKKDAGQEAPNDPPATGTNHQAPREGNRPIKEVRMGRIRCSVWRNNSAQHGTWFSFTFSLSFKDKDGQWRSATSFGVDDLLVLAEVARLARIWVEDEQQKERQKPRERQPGDDTGQEHEEVELPPGL